MTVNKSCRTPVPAIIVTLALLFVCALLAGELKAKSFRITKVSINAKLQPDGSMAVSELRTYDFNGTFRFAYRDMPATGPVAFGDFEVLEDGRPYRQSDSEEPGTYRITRESGSKRITWFYRASDEARVFEFRYVAAGAIKRYEDVALLYYQFISQEWTIRQSGISINLEPPAPLRKSDVKVWLHGPLWAESRIKENGTILALCDRLPGGTYLEIRALYPPGEFPDVPPTAGTVRTEIMVEEAAWAEEANRRREEAKVQRAAWEERRAKKKKWALGLSGGIGAIGLALWSFIRGKFRNPPELPQFLEMNSDIPDKTPPALLSYLLHNRSVSGPALIGTMLDLARRGFVKLREERVRKKSFWGGMKTESEYHWDLDRAHWTGNKGELLPYENSLLEFIFDELALGTDSIELETIKSKRGKFLKFFRTWKKQVQQSGEDKGWFDRLSIRGLYYSLAVGLAMIVLAVPMAIFLGPWGIVLGGVGVVVTILSAFIPHRTAEGETKAKHWKAVGKYLKTYEFRNTNRQSLLAQVSDYLVYGVVLGLSTKFYKEIAALIPEQAHATYVPWYIYRGTGTAGFSPEAFGEAFSSMVATTTSTMSSAAGTGGGASGGGGGGASSGGGGAG
jgi:uncharacterized membrane protein YgcG